MTSASSYVTKDYVAYGNMIDLSDADAAWLALDKRVRTSVRKGEKMHVVIRPFDGSPEELDALAAFTPNDDDIPAAFEDRHYAYVACDADDGRRLGWILLAGIPGTRKVFLLCHASLPEGKERQTPNLLLWHVIQTWAGKQYRYLDVGASYRQSLQKYFEGFAQMRYPMIMRPPAMPLDIRMTPCDVATYGMASGDPARGRDIVRQLAGDRPWTFFPLSTFAVRAAFKELQLQGRMREGGSVFLCTTFGRGSIAADRLEMLASAISLSDTLDENTEAVLLMHDFGVPNPRSQEMREWCTLRGIPLVEDATDGWGNADVGLWGDLSILSLMHAFPLQFGAALIGAAIPFDRMWHVHASFDGGKEEETMAQLAVQYEDLDVIAKKRRAAYARYAENLISIGDSLIALNNGAVPTVFPFRFQDAATVHRVATFVRRFGIEVREWVEQSTVLFPCHARLTDRHVDYICGSILANFRENCGVPHDE